MRSADLNKKCPTCGSDVGYQCVTGSGRVAGEVHQARLYGVKVSKSNKLKPVSSRHGQDRGEGTGPSSVA